jgi:NTP pyrophosphatase (non-canonical NTP hydrolase)
VSYKHPLSGFNSLSGDNSPAKTKDNIMDFSVYQSASGATAQFPPGVEALYYLTLGLTSEAGEVAGKVKKAIRDEGGVFSEERREAIKYEIGDVLWYCAQLAEQLEIDFNEIARANLAKLSARKLVGAISGDGDYR